jgi:GH15 family glucan-1,4-alpha-glucosidase
VAADVSARIEDYALLSNTRGAALVSRDGSVDWLCLPRFDSDACLAALLGDAEHGRFLVAPAGGTRRTTRRYRDGTLVLETEHETADGVVSVIDAMPARDGGHELVRLVVGRAGRVPMELDLTIRLGYGRWVPWVTVDGGIALAACGPDNLRLSTPISVREQDASVRAEFTVGEGQVVPFTLTWFGAHEPEPPHLDPLHLVLATERWWRDWSGACTYSGAWRDAVLRSLITLKALTYSPTGGIVAAPTTSLPEQLGGVRNWDYRFCWLRDAAFTLSALHDGGYQEEARAWREWLLRAVAGEPHAIQIMYGVAGERRLPEHEADWLPGHAGSRPVRIGNAAAEQFQLDVYGEVADAQFQLAKDAGLHPAQQGLANGVIEFLASAWQEPDDGIWEVRGQRRHFTYSKVMAWVGLDRAVRAVEELDLEGPLERWRALRDQIHTEVCREGFDHRRNTFVQSYGSPHLDAALLKLPLVGFLAPEDPRVAGTVEAVQRELTVGDGLLLRYGAGARGAVDGVEGREGAFLACSFWLVDNLTLLGRVDEARDLFERLLALTNDVGLLAEEYDTAEGRQMGNFPQALSHIALVNSAALLSRALEGQG